MTDENLKTATKEILSLGFLDDSGQRIEFKDEMDFITTIKEVIPQLNNKDFFTKDTTAVLAEFGWTREKAGETVKESFSPESIVEDTLLQDIENCEKLRELKEIALSEPQFKKIRGKLSSFDLDTLKMEMINILVPPKINPVIEAFENEKTDSEKPAYVKKLEAVQKESEEVSPVKDLMQSLDKLDNLITEKDLKVKDNGFDELDDIPEPNARELFGSGLVNIKDIVRKEPFSSLFDINLVTLESIKANMKNNGYDFAFPVILWDNVLIDGFTRTKAAEEVGINDILCEQKQFKDEHEALEYAMHNQRDRRNITEAELLRCISVIDTPMSKTEAGAKRGEKKVPTHKQTAKTLGIGESKVTDARTVLTDEQAIEDVKNAKKTMHEAAEEIRSRKRKPKETISEALTKVESVIQILKDNAGKEMKLGLLLKQSESLGVKEDMMSIIMEVLTAVSLIKINEDKISIKKAIK